MCVSLVLSIQHEVIATSMKFRVHRALTRIHNFNIVRSLESQEINLTTLRKTYITQGRTVSTRSLVNQRWLTLAPLSAYKLKCVKETRITRKKKDRTIRSFSFFWVRGYFPPFAPQSIKVPWEPELSKRTLPMWRDRHSASRSHRSTWELILYTSSFISMNPNTTCKMAQHAYKGAPMTGIKPASIAMAKTIGR